MITLAIAIVALILILTIVGVMLSNKSEVVFPPSKNTCPDYWSQQIDASNNSVCKIDNRNIGTFSTDKTATPGYNADNQTIDFNAPGWGNQGNSSTLCSLQKWCHNKKISWDGVSNYNGCK